MKMHPQIISKNNLPEFVVLPFAEYESLLEQLEDQEDLASVKAFQEQDQATLPFDLLQSIVKGENAIRAFRIFRKFSQAQLAKKAGVSRQYLHQIENQLRQGSVKTLQKIAVALKIDVQLLLPISSRE